VHGIFGWRTIAWWLALTAAFERLFTSLLVSRQRDYEQCGRGEQVLGGAASVAAAPASGGCRWLVAWLAFKAGEKFNQTLCDDRTTRFLSRFAQSSEIGAVRITTSPRSKAAWPPPLPTVLPPPHLVAYHPAASSHCRQPLPDSFTPPLALSQSRPSECVSRSKRPPRASVSAAPASAGRHFSSFPPPSAFGLRCSARALVPSCRCYRGPAGRLPESDLHISFALSQSDRSKRPAVRLPPKGEDALLVRSLCSLPLAPCATPDALTH
jgi:hypothetical protein